ncbi:polysaccharide lyase [Enterovibrio makurazakiensis]|uniref:heparin lyase I family protein n=1 Tax=Enterovibrio makurazakiensis TaxID=2910232 RepID=UPI003D2417A3
MNMVFNIKLIPPLMSLLVSGCVSLTNNNHLPQTGSFDLFQRSLSTTEHGYRISPDTTGSAPTKMIDVFDVRPGDCSFNSGWNDCQNDRERSERSETNKSTGLHSEYWYGWSIYFPKDYPNVYPTKVALGQFHQKDSHPVWMFQNSKGGYHLDNQVMGHSSHYYPLIEENKLRGRWHRIEVNVRWENNQTGFFRVWVNGNQKVNYEGATMDASYVYFKYGLYRSFLSRYKNENNVDSVPAQTVYFSNVKRSLSRDGLSE